MARQSKTGSILETLWQFSLGFALSWAVYEFLINRMVREDYIAYDDSLLIVFIVSMFSLFRQYIIRRCSVIFNHFLARREVKSGGGKGTRQRNIDSLFESIYQVLVGLVIYYFVYELVVFPLAANGFFAIDNSLVVTIIFSLFSIVRQLAIRRMYVNNINVYLTLSGLVQAGGKNFQGICLGWLSPG